MDGIKVRALVCGTQDYKESDKLVELCSVEEGKLSVLVKGCRKPNSKLRFATIPFCFAEYVLSEKGGYYTLTGCTLIEQFGELSSDIDKFYAGNVILECLRRFTREGENIARLVVLALEYLKKLAYEEHSTTLCIVAFLVDFLKNTGYELDFSECRVCRAENMVKRYFSYVQGGLVCGVCAGQGAESMSAQATGFLRSLTSGMPLGVMRFDESVMRESLSLVSGYVAYTMGRGLNSVKQYLDISK